MIKINRLKELRLSRDMTMRETAKQLGLPYTTYVNYEKGLREPNSETLISFANLYGVSVDYVIGRTADAEPYNFTEYENIIPVPNFNTVPLLGTIACGEPILAAENLEGEVKIPDDINADFALRCSGDSMIDARILDGDIVYIRQQPTVNNGEIAAVLIGEEATLKKVFISEGTITLLACNSNYQPFVYSGEKLNEIRILGKAVGFMSRI